MILYINNSIRIVGAIILLRNVVDISCFLLPFRSTSPLLRIKNPPLVFVGESCKAYSKLTIKAELPTYTKSSLWAEKLKVAIVGSGAVGCYYGARLWECHQYDVMFHMRGEHLQASLSKGLNVTSVAGDIFIPPEDLLAYEDTNEMGYWL